MLRYLSPADRVIFFEKFIDISESQKHREAGKAFEARNSISYPPYPAGLEIGLLLCNLLRLPSCIDDEQVRAIAKMHITSCIFGVQHFLRDRWGYTLVPHQSLPSRYKPLGDWYAATYRLCEKVAPYISKAGEKNPAIGLNAAHWMHKCIQEIALNEGLFTLLDVLYPPKNLEDKRNSDADNNAALRRDKLLTQKNCDKKEFGRYFNYIISRIKALETPHTGKGGIPSIGYFGTLLRCATIAAEHDHDIQTSTMKEFISATREYLKAITSGNNSVRLFINSNGIAGQQQVPKHPFEKLTSISPSQQAIREVRAKKFQPP